MRVLMRPSRPGMPLRQWFCTAVAAMACLAGAFAPARAQTSDVASDALDSMSLRSSPLLQETIDPAQSSAGPVFLQGDRMSGRPDQEVVIEGDAELRKAGTVIHADRLEYDQPHDLAKARGNVRINRGGSVYEGPLMELKVESFEGFFNEPRYHFLQNGAHGQAFRADFKDESHTTITDGTYTTCRRKPGPDWIPDWILRADSITLDKDEDEGIARNAVMRFKGVPVLPFPSLGFPLSDKRRSGFLPPTMGVDSINGSEVVLPYYWNIAPNRDATITPTLMTLRGVDLGGEFRYLEPGNNGIVRANYMGADKLRGTDRWGLAYLHTGSVATGLPEVGAIGIAANINRVSDDDYWRDFTRTSATLTQRLLPSSVLASWGRGNFSTTAQVFKWQTLQDLSAPIVPPYDRVPQLTARYALSNVNGFDASADVDFTQFESDRLRTLQPNTQRFYSLLQFSRPVLGAAGFLIPKLQLHAVAYQFDADLSTGARAADSVVPTFSLDSGLVFERDVGLFGNALVQTLEPRAFYVHTPYRNQSMQPNYDTGVNDFNWATIFTENNFVGHDKISDNNLLTLGLTTRFLDPDSGAQLARFGVAQRLRFEEQQVTLTPGLATAPAGFSDVLLGATININDRWALDSTLQYNPRTEQSERSTVGARYSPGPYRVLNAAYRTQRNVSEQIDLSWQWPLNPFGGDARQGEGRYYTVGRLNFSVVEQRLVDTIFGVEYDAGCWLGRVVLDRVQTSVSTSTDRLMFQLEFVGFTRLGWGASPQETLKRNISRYQNLRESLGPSSRFSNYD